MKRIIETFIILLTALCAAMVLMAGGYSNGPFYDGSWLQAGKVFSHCQPITGGSQFFGCNGQTAPTSNTTCPVGGGGGGATSINTLTRHWVRYTAGTTAADRCGLDAAAGAPTQATFPFKQSFLVQSGSVITNTRYWLALTETALSGTAPAIGPGASVIDHVGLAYDDAVDPSWFCCAGDGVNKSCTDTGINVATGTIYLVSLDRLTAGVLTCVINGVATNHATNLPTTAIAAGLFWDVVVTTTGGAVNHALDLAWLEIAQP